MSTGTDNPIADPSPADPLILTIDAPPSLVKVGPDPLLLTFTVPPIPMGGKPSSTRYVVRTAAPPDQPLSTSTRIFGPIADSTWVDVAANPGNLDMTLGIIAAPGVNAYGVAYQSDPTPLSPGRYAVLVAPAKGFGLGIGQVSINVGSEGTIDRWFSHLKHLFGSAS